VVHWRNEEAVTYASASPIANVNVQM
jgi:hypothetical protein